MEEYVVQHRLCCEFPINKQKIDKNTKHTLNGIESLSAYMSFRVMSSSPIRTISTHAYPSVLKEASTFIKQRLRYISLCTDSQDGRINSIKDEDTVLRCLNEKFRIQKPKDRYWYDVAIHDPETDKWIPINIKVSEGGCDNALNKKAIVFSYTTLEDKEIPGNLQFNKMIELIEDNMKDARNTSKEYYYMCVDKNEKDVTIRSLCDIQEFRSNPQNWLQIHWKKEKQIDAENIPMETPQESFHRVKSVIGDSLYKLLATSFKLLSVDCKNDHLTDDVMAIVERIKLDSNPTDIPPPIPKQQTE